MRPRRAFHLATKTGLADPRDPVEAERRSVGIRNGTRRVYGQACALPSSP